MATLATHLTTVDEFLGMAFDTDERYELDNGVVRLMAGGTAIHARIQTNVLVALAGKLAGTGCSPFGPDMGVQTHQLSLRYPDVSVFCGRDGQENDRLKAFDDPKLVVEILSHATRTRDIEVKLPEYRSVASLDAILYIDPDDQTVHLETRDEARGWGVTTYAKGDQVELPQLGVALAWNEIFPAR
jgi:Uma2 family endonuclease